MGGSASGTGAGTGSIGGGDGMGDGMGEGTLARTARAYPGPRAPKRRGPRARRLEPGAGGNGGRGWLD